MTRRYPYRPRVRTLIVAVLFFGACAAILGHFALRSTSRLDVSGLVELSPGGARVFYGVLALLSLGFVVIGIVVPILIARRKPEIVVDDDTISVPRPLWKRAPRVIRFADIRALAEQDVFGQQFITIDHGAKTSIAKQQVGDRAYDELRGLLAAKVRAR